MILQNVIFKNQNDVKLSDVVKINGSKDLNSIAQLTGTGTLSATIKVTTGIYNNKHKRWEISNSSTYTISGNNSIFDQKILDMTSHIQYEITAISGTGARLSLALLNVQ